MLAEIQKQFLDALLDEAHSLHFIASENPLERFKIYQQNIQENLCHALSLTFPGTWALLGEKCADAAARHYAQAHHPHSRCLEAYGKTFPSFLSEQKALCNLPYLKDYASYEWLMHELTLSEEDTPMDGNTLLEFDEETLKTLSFIPIANARWYYCSYPLLEIQKLIEDNNAKTIELKDIESHLLLFRKQGEIYTHLIDAACWVFIHHLFAQMPLEFAIEQTTQEYPHFELTQSIAFILEKGLIKQVDKESI